MTRPAKRGFTLIELLVVISLLAVVTTLSTVTLVRLWDIWGDLHLATQLDRAADNVLELMREDISAAVSSTTAGVALEGATGSGEDPRFFGIKLAGDRFSIPVEVPMASGKAAMGVGYHIERQGDEWWLVRTVQPLRGGGEPSKQNVAKGVIQMRVEYAGAGGGWSDSWAGPGNPRVLRIHLTLAAPGNPLRQQTARKAVFPVHVP